MIFTACNLGFKSEETPVEKLEFAVRLDETLQLFYWSSAMLNGEKLEEDPEADFPLAGIFPAELTSYTGNVTGTGGEEINYDFSDCITRESCRGFVKIFYPGNSRIKERELVVDLKDIYSGGLTSGVVYAGNDSQRMRDGSRRVVEFRGGRSGSICIKTTFPPLSPVESEQKCYYFDSITFSVRCGWFAGNVTYFTGRVELDDGRVIEKKSSSERIHMESPSFFSLSITVGEWFSFKDLADGNSLTFSSTTTGETPLKSIYNTQQKASPVVRREVIVEEKNGVNFEQEIIYNDGHVDKIKITSLDGIVQITYNDFKGKVAWVSHPDSVTFSGRLQSKEGTFDFTASSILGGLWHFSYWWDKFDKKKVSPDEEGDLKYFLLSKGTGSVTLYDRNEKSASASYEIDFFTGLIR